MNIEDMTMTRGATQIGRRTIRQSGMGAIVKRSEKKQVPSACARHPCSVDRAVQLTIGLP